MNLYSVEEICEEQERQYNQLMEEDDQYCHPESFKWGFEHGFEYALTKLGWHPANEPPKEWHYDHFIEAREVFLFVTNHKLMPGEFVPFKDCSGVALMYYSDKRLPR